MIIKHTVTPSMVEVAQDKIIKHYKLSKFAEDRLVLVREYAEMLAAEYDLRKKEGKQKKSDLVEQLTVWWSQTCAQANRFAKPNQDRISDPMRDMVVLAFRLAVNDSRAKPTAKPKQKKPIVRSLESYWFNFS